MPTSFVSKDRPRFETESNCLDSSEQVEIREEFKQFYTDVVDIPDGEFNWPLDSCFPDDQQHQQKRPVNKSTKSRPISELSSSKTENHSYSMDENLPFKNTDEYLRFLRFKRRRNHGREKHDVWQIENVEIMNVDDKDAFENLNSECTPKITSSPTLRKSSHSLRQLFPRRNQIISSAENSDSEEINRIGTDLKTVGADNKLDKCRIENKNIFKSEDEDEDSVANITSDSVNLFLSPRKRPAPKDADDSVLCTPISAETRMPRASRISARRLFPCERSEEPQTPCTPKSSKPRKMCCTPKLRLKSLTPSRGRIETPLRTPTTPRDKARHALALSAAPESLPCREEEFKVVYEFVREKITSNESGVICINGVPGTGKTATISRVLKKLTKEMEKKKLNKFKAINVNAFDLRKSKDVFCKVYEQLFGVRKTAILAEQLLGERFETKKRNPRRLPIVLVIDEFDCLLAKKCDVIYKLVEWQANDNSQLVLLTIANKLDFSNEKKLFSRIKFERLAFNAYSFKELEKIIANRLEGFDRFTPEAIQFIARKVAATSGDARKALDICKQVLDTVEAEDENFSFTIKYVNKLLEQIFSNPSVQIIKQLTNKEKVALRAVRDVLSRSDKPFCSLWNGVWDQFRAIASLEGITRIEINCLLRIYAYLARIGLLKVETEYLDQYSKIWLKCDPDVIHNALTQSL